MKNKPVMIIATLLLLAVSLVVPSCNIDGDLVECPYNARLEYWYTGTGQANVLPDYIFRMQEFVFDSLNILRQVNELGGKKNIAAELDLSPGRYTLVAWGNLDSCSSLNEAEIGRTRLTDILLYANNPVPPETRVNVPLRQQNGELLYYGYTSFTVQSQGVSRQRVDMVHAHLKLDITVKWKGKAPTDTGDMYMSLSGMPSAYGFLPEFEVKGSPYSTYGTAADGNPTRSGVWYYIPERPEDYPLITYEVPVKMDITCTVNATFISYRIGSDDHPVVRLYGGGKQLLKDIDLYKYFRTMQIDLDENLRQEFSLVMEVDAAGGVIVSSATVSDWVDGGAIGGMI
ncbi:FimB/Mfa2 family fimbrial subunit [Parabacteroides gordonii]|uniref:FimB/Mfa2 family fimbrial subunit n=1 Tax=Parabacteroides gordonii TaxID=574930 RepID=UPI0026E92FF3|nr:FimB/Mfa2 family fimbrial subunit [Parabacteroides gordonii]